MKTSVRTVILSAAAIFAAISCQKEESVPGTQDIVKAGETIQLSIDASLGDLIAADGTKATAKTVVRLTWGDDDTVDAYFGATKLNTEPITVTPSENKLSAKLSGTINASSLTSGTSVITFVYHSGAPQPTASPSTSQVRMTAFPLWPTLRLNMTERKPSTIRWSDSSSQLQ